MAHDLPLGRESSVSNVLGIDRAGEAVGLDVVQQAETLSVRTFWLLNPGETAMLGNALKSTDDVHKERGSPTSF